MTEEQQQFYHKGLNKAVRLCDEELRLWGGDAYESIGRSAIKAVKRRIAKHKRAVKETPPAVKA